MMSEEPVLYTFADGVARIRLNRPDVGNALDGAVARAIGVAVDAIAAEPGVRAVVLCANGRHFSAGGDIGEFLRERERLAEVIGESLLSFNRTLAKLAHLPVPVVTALNGPVAGGGIGFALTADLVVAAESARFRSGYSAIGLSPDCGASFFLVRALGATRAKELLFTNRSLSAAEALACGLVNRVVPDDDLERATDALVAELVALPRGSLAAIKTLAGEISDGLYERTLARERELMIENAAGSDVREGIAAFAERRAPVFA
jgi:2-(1,2-epoxy-1,2-dihydrophenyl)acetyl-CoA isomerase